MCMGGLCGDIHVCIGLCVKIYVGALYVCVCMCFACEYTCVGVIYMCGYMSGVGSCVCGG